jgi:hypothetical protein
MTDPAKELERLQAEIDQFSSEAAATKHNAKGDVETGRPKKVSGRFDAVLTGAGLLLVLGLAVSFASRLNRDQITGLTAASLGAAAGLVVGYGLGKSDGGTG